MQARRTLNSRPPPESTGRDPGRDSGGRRPPMRAASGCASEVSGKGCRVVGGERAEGRRTPAGRWSGSREVATTRRAGTAASQAPTVGARVAGGLLAESTARDTTEGW
jgi:hypothetical protein